MTEIRDLAKLLSGMKRRSALANTTPQLSSSAIVDGSIDLVTLVDTGAVDEHGYSVIDEVVQASVGLQEDGSTTVVVLDGPTPPAPTGLTADAGAGTITVGWAGAFADGAKVTLDHDHIAIHVAPKALVDAMTLVFPSDATMAATIRSLVGGQVTLAREAGTAYYVALVAVTQADKTSDLSEVLTVTPRRLVELDFEPESITETLIAPDAVTSPKIKAGAVQTGHLEAESVTADKLAAVMALVTRLLAGPEAGNHVELNPLGLFAYALTGAGVVPVIKLGTGDVDVFTLTDGDGNRLASILGTGAASFQALDTEVLMVAGEELDDILAPLPQGLIGRAAKTTDSASIGSTETAYLEFRAVLPKGRQVRFELPSFYATAGTSGCITHYNVRVAYDGAAVSTTSDLFASTRVYHATTYQTKVPPCAIEFDTADQVADLREVRFLLTAYRATGSGTFVIKSQVEATTPVQMLLYDSGLPVGNAGVDNTVIRRVSVWNPSSVLLNGAAAINPGDLLGWAPGAQWAQALFLDTAVSGETDKSIPSALAGATIEKVEAILYLDPFEDAAWIMGAIRANDLVAADTTVPSGTPVEFEKNTTSRWKATVDITAIFTGTARGLWIGYPVSDPGGCWTDAATPLQLRITYKR